MMEKKDFLIKANTKHNNKYGYEKVPEVFRTHDKIEIVCPIHGNFFQVAKDHLNGRGCKKCGVMKSSETRTYTKDEFVKKARKIHGYFYNYDKVVYKKGSDKVIITCPIHGDFKQTPIKHLFGHGCPECANERISKAQKKGSDEFIRQSRERFGDKFNYSKVDYKNNKTKVTLICPIHGEFKITPASHLKSIYGCLKCGNEAAKKAITKDKSHFIKKATAVHGDKYDYSKVDYKDSHTKVCIICPKHGEFWQTPFNHINEHGCPKCVRQISKWEQEVYDFIISLGVDAEHSNREILDGREIDIYLPEEHIGIECDGLRWHNETHKPKNYHLEKTNACKDKGVRLIHIFEDEWVHNSEIWKSMLRNMFGKIENRIYARNCEVREVNAREKRRFLKHNHIQGNAQSTFNYGLFHNGELVSLMTFGNPRINMGGKKKEGSYELVRFCNKINTNVIGGAGKLFSHFVKEHNPSEIVSYSDKRWATGKLYEILGFENTHDSRPNYFYVDNLTRENRFKYRKSELVKEGYDKNKTEHEIMLERGIFRIYDCGTKVWKWKK